MVSAFGISAVFVGDSQRLVREKDGDVRHRCNPLMKHADTLDGRQGGFIHCRP